MENYCNSLPLFIYSVPHLLKHTLNIRSQDLLEGKGIEQFDRLAI